jgi:hypothetical protein
MNFITSNWIWILVVVFFAGMYFFRRGRGEGMEPGQAQGSEPYAHNDHKPHATTDDGSHPAQSQERPQGHKHHGGCC